MTHSSLKFKLTKQFEDCYFNMETSFAGQHKTLVKDIIAEHKESINVEIWRNISHLRDPTFKIQFAVDCKYDREVNDVMEEKSWYVSNCAVEYDGAGSFLDEGAEKLDEKLASYAAGSTIIGFILVSWFPKIYRGPKYC